MARKAEGARFGVRGQRLWDGLRAARPFNAAEVVVLEELCRHADRLDKLDRLLSGDAQAWARVEKPHEGASTLVLVLDDGLAEARQLAATFQKLAASLRLPEAQAEVKKDGIGDLAARRAARRATG